MGRWRLAAGSGHSLWSLGSWQVHLDGCSLCMPWGGSVAGVPWGGSAAGVPWTLKKGS